MSAEGFGGGDAAITHNFYKPNIIHRPLVTAHSTYATMFHIAPYEIIPSVLLYRATAIVRRMTLMSRIYADNTEEVFFLTYGE